MSRKCRLQKVSNILQTPDVAEAMVRLRDKVPDKTTECGESDMINPLNTVPCINLSGKGIKGDGPSVAGVDADAGVVSLIADTLMQAFPPERLRRCRIVYERRQSGRRCTNPVGAWRMIASPAGEGNDDNLIVDPHPLEWYGEALHTPVEVLALFPDL
ncbi:hypothetical protein HanRHA438_Chr03g0108351 [Helianthus annuus]|nr:hypothetical protein HanRHA438_Chr03g0108351 [Helianthus annuus]